MGEGLGVNRYRGGSVKDGNGMSGWRFMGSGFVPRLWRSFRRRGGLLHLQQY